MSNFSISSFFDDSNVNALLDRMYFEIINAFPDKDINAVFCLTGKAAALHQDAKFDDDSCSNIIFLTNDHELHVFFQGKLPKLIASEGAVNFTARTLLYFPGVFMEIWYQEGNISSKEVNKIFVQDLQKINPILL